MCVRFVSVAVIVAVLVGCRSESRTSKTGSAPGEVSVAAAADLKFALDEISREFGKQNRGIRVNAERRCVRQSSSGRVGTNPLSMSAIRVLPGMLRR